MSGLGMIVVAAGSSSRMGKIDKVWAPLGDHPVLLHSLLRLSGQCSRTVIVARADDLERMRNVVSQSFPDIEVVAGGMERQDSVARGLEVLADVDTVAVHDAARPFPPADSLETGVSLLNRAEGALPAIQVSDTVKEVSPEGLVLRTLHRPHLRAVQTPQLFQAAALRSCHAEAVTRGLRSTDDASLVEQCQQRVMCFPGRVTNLKITTELDLAIARYLLESGAVQ